MKSGKQISDLDTVALEMILGRWQPDFMARSQSIKKIALGQDVCRLAVRHAEKLVEAYGTDDQKLYLEMHAADHNRKQNLLHKAIFGEKSSSLISTFKLV